MPPTLAQRLGAAGNDPHQSRKTDRRPRRARARQPEHPGAGRPHRSGGTRYYGFGRALIIALSAARIDNLTHVLLQAIPRPRITTSNSSSNRSAAERSARRSRLRLLWRTHSRRSAMETEGAMYADVDVKTAVNRGIVPGADFRASNFKLAVQKAAKIITVPRSLGTGGRNRQTAGFSVLPACHLINLDGVRRN